MTSQPGTLETGVTAGELVIRAERLAARLMNRGAAAEKAGRLPDETIQDVTEADLMRIAVPKRFGGLEVDYWVVPQVSRALGRGCLATSWTIGILIQHNWQIGLYPQEAQEEIWANGPNVFAPGFIIPGGMAKRVPGGFRLSGHWRFGSGFPHGQWILLSAFEAQDGKRGPLRRFALPIADVTPENNWDVSGMGASATWDCVLDETFVPSHRQMLASSMLDCTAPGLQINQGPLWRIPMLSFYYPNMAAMMLGAAEGVAALVTKTMKGRVLSYGGAQAAQLGYVQTNIGKNHAKLNAAAALLESEARRIWTTTLGRDPFATRDRAGVRANCTYVVKQAREIVNELCDQAGTSSFFMASPLQRFHREVNVLSSHAFYDYDRMATVYGQAILEQPLPEGELI